MLRAAAWALLGASLAGILLYPDRVDSDVAMYGYMGSLLLEGAVPYVDMIDLNPPLVIYVSAIPAAVSRLLGAPLLLTCLLFAWAAAAASMEVSHRLLRRLDPHSAAAGLMAVAMAGFSLATLATDDFGQREHLFVLALVPFLLLGARPGLASGTHAAVIGAAAGLTACFKPHFIAIALAPLGLRVLTSRSARELRAPEVIAFVAVGAAYAAHFVVLPPDMRAALFDRWLPFIAERYYGYDRELGAMLARWEFWLPPLAAIPMGILVRGRPGFERLGIALATAAAMSVLMFFAQKKGWHHHAAPAYAVLGVATALVAGAGLDRVALRAPVIRAMRFAAFATAACVWLLCALLAAAPALRARMAGPPPADPLADAVRAHSRPGDQVFVMSTSVGPAFPMLASLERRQGSRYMFAFPIPMLYAGAPAAHGQPFDYTLTDPALARDEARYRADLEEDLATRKPALVAIMPACMACPEGATLAGYLEARGVMRYLQSQYRELPPINGTRLFLRTAG